ncbi:MAG: Holliday junction branch migration protein RuvA [Desulfonatronovibrionaceae bacterium]
MIAYLKGTVLRAKGRSCLLVTGQGVGYEVFLSPRGLQGLQASDEAEIFVYTVVREDALELYGFLTWEERETFAVLVDLPKLGPKTALAMLNCFTPCELSGLAAANDERALASVPGIGVKTARRILLDLKDRLDFVHPGPAGTVYPADAGKSVHADVLSGLATLGYGSAEVGALVTRVLEEDPDMDVSGAIRAVLKLKAQERQ